MSNTRKRNNFSKAFKNVSELTDVISVVIYCVDDKTYLIAHDYNLDYHIPYVPVSTYSWKLQVQNFVKEYLGVTVEINAHLWRIIRFWKSDEEPYLLNTIFEIPICKDTKNKAKIYKLNQVSKTSWMTQEDFEQLYYSEEHMMCPDVVIHITIGHEPAANLALLKGCAIVQNYNLVEVTKEQVIENSRNHVYDNLLSGLTLTVSDITVLHNEYLKFTYPNIIMGTQGLYRFGSVVGWNDYLRITAFRGADMDGKRGITFREFLYLIYAVDPFAEFKGNALEARNRFVFKCFDLSKDDKLSPQEFTALIQSVQASRRSSDGPNISIDVEIEVTLRAMDLRPGTDVPMNTFLHIAGTSRFSYFLNVLRASNTIREYICSIRDRKALHSPPKIKSCSDNAIPRSNRQDFILSSYISRIDHGVVAETIDIDKVDGIVLRDIKRPLEKSSSADIYSVNALPQNEILRYLKYFANSENNQNEDELVKHNVVRTSERPKEKFSWGWVDIEYFIQLLIRVCENVTHIFNEEKRMLLLKSPVYIIGDIHGNFQDLCCFERNIWPLGISLLPCNLLFLGDLVDRGENGIETVAYLFAQKIRFPQSLFLIRGNHEIRSTQKQNVHYITFYKECVRRCGLELGIKLWNAVNDVFDCMPLAATVDNKVFCCHGGIPPPWVCPTIHAIQSVPTPLPNPEINGIAWELMWNDPARECQITEKVKLEMAANEGFGNNIRRSTGHIFNEKALDKFLQVNQLSFLVRAHESQKAGFQIHHNWKMLTVFSSSFYSSQYNKAACALIQSNGKIKVVQLTTDEYHPEKIRDSRKHD
ncbi:unnamed protein product [Nezara viridula]|uniref:Serine/threonine-protein phosphatase n=1 Tax=Nezara viridula TaxID=85310 RepID=A0A9P0HPM1_NEZVI|nr:unnamed protein product [Nezara viridula]